MNIAILELAEELRQYTAMRYAGDCKCGKCQLVQRELIDRVYMCLVFEQIKHLLPSDAAKLGEYIRKHAAE